MYTAAGIRVRMCTCINKGACTRGRGAGKSTTMGEHEVRIARRGGKRISRLLTRRWTERSHPMDRVFDETAAISTYVPSKDKGNKSE